MCSLIANSNSLDLNRNLLLCVAIAYMINFNLKIKYQFIIILKIIYLLSTLTHEAKYLEELLVLFDYNLCKINV